MQTLVFAASLQIAVLRRIAGAQRYTRRRPQIVLGDRGTRRASACSWRQVSDSGGDGGDGGGVGRVQLGGHFYFQRAAAHRPHSASFHRRLTLLHGDRKTRSNANFHRSDLFCWLPVGGLAASNQTNLLHFIGVFLYVGIQSLLGQQFVQRIALLFMPQKKSTGLCVRG